MTVARPQKKLGRKKQKKNLICPVPTLALGKEAFVERQVTGRSAKNSKKNSKNLCRVSLGPALGKSFNLKAQNGTAQPHPLLTPLPTAPAAAPPVLAALAPAPGRRSHSALVAQRLCPGGPAPAPRVPGRRPELAGAPSSELPGDSDPAGPELPRWP